jgi:hypothetical protein
MLEKNYEMLKKQDSIDFLVFNPKKIPKIDIAMEKKKKINKNKIRKELLRKVRDIAQQLSSINITIRLNGQDYSILYGRNKPITITYQETLNPEIFPWYMIKFPNLTTLEIYQVYKELIPNELIYSQIILKKKSLRLKSKPRHFEPIVQIIPEYQYCYCRQFKNDDTQLVGKFILI